MSADQLISRLEGVRQTGSDRWIARCSGHEDRRASLSIREVDDGRVLLYCFAGCTAEEVLNAIGLDFSVLFPDKPKGGSFVRNPRRAFNAMDVLTCSALEATIAHVAASDLANGKTLSETDRQRLLLSAVRLSHAVEVASGR
jgi:hypothetical protein